MAVENQKQDDQNQNSHYPEQKTQIKEYLVNKEQDETTFILRKNQKLSGEPR